MGAVLLLLMVSKEGEIGRISDESKHVIVYPFLMNNATICIKKAYLLFDCVNYMYM